MMDKADHIKFWTTSAESSWDVAMYLHNGSKNAESLFMYCLAIEKLLKAVWVYDNVSNTPPRIHDLQSLMSQTELELDPELTDFLDTVNRWNLEGRYPDYKFRLVKLATKDYMSVQIDKLDKVKKCILEKLSRPY